MPNALPAPEAIIEPKSNAKPSREAWLRKLACLQDDGAKFDRCIDHPTRSSVDAYSYSAQPIDSFQSCC